MCSYAALTNPTLQSDSASHPHSEPCCASKFFAITKMQEEYGFEGYVQSDCGAVGNEGKGRENYAANATDAAVKAIVDGHMNSNCVSLSDIPVTTAASQSELICLKESRNILVFSVRTFSKN